MPPMTMNFTWPSSSPHLALILPCTHTSNHVRLPPPTLTLYPQPHHIMPPAHTTAPATPRHDIL